MGTLPQMATGAGLVIKINSVTIAYAQSMSFADRMATAPQDCLRSHAGGAAPPTTADLSNQPLNIVRWYRRAGPFSVLEV